MAEMPGKIENWNMNYPSVYFTKHKENLKIAIHETVKLIFNLESVKTQN